jgi:hypothetical protein
MIEQISAGGVTQQRLPDRSASGTRCYSSRWLDYIRLI